MSGDFRRDAIDTDMKGLSRTTQSAGATSKAIGWSALLADIDNATPSPDGEPIQ
jgi:hypothetical protein